jgi:hypothetical protein
VLIFASGGHDRLRLKEASRETLLSNDNLAYLRAKSMSCAFKDALRAAREKAGRPQTEVAEELGTRGVWDTSLETSSDRTVTITLLRWEQAS